MPCTYIEAWNLGAMLVDQFVQLKRFVMKVSRYTPIEDFFKGFWINPMEFSFAAQPMDTEIRESESSYFVDVDLPGIHKEDIDVSIQGRRVSINANRKEWQEESDAKLIKTEMRYGKVYRQFEMEHEMTEEGAEAKFEEGVLHVVLPKKNGLPAKLLSIR
ncbi:MAG: Hsp20 family protein [Rhodocyclaceae bacterium]|nr:Hsp20 family protein [Rhodocyclaceae bacterium]